MIKSKNSEYENFLSELKEKLNITPWNDWRSKSDRDRIGVSWSLGGTSGNCFDDQVSSISPDAEPEFTEIDSVLEHYCPYLSYTQYKYMHNKLLHKDQKYESDYYSGGITYGYKYIYLDELLTYYFFYLIFHLHRLYKFFLSFHQ